MGSIRNKNNWNNASKRLFGSYSYSGIPGFHSGYSAPRSRIAGIYSGIHSYSGIFPNERALNDVRQRLQEKDEWTISYRDYYETPYTRLWHLMLKQGDIFEALFAVEEGRAQALRDLMQSNYETKTPYKRQK